MVDVGAAFVADEQPFEVVQPGEGALDDPALTAEAGAVLGLASCDLGLDPALPEFAAVLVVVVAAVSCDDVGTSARADLAAHRRHPLDQRHQLRDVVAVAARERPGERDTAAVYEQVVLAAYPATINRAGPRLRAPFFACT